MNTSRPTLPRAVAAPALAFLLLAGACSRSPAEPESPIVVFGPAMAVVSPVSMFPQQAVGSQLATRGDTLFVWRTVFSEYQTPLSGMCPSCPKTPTTGTRPGVRWAAGGTGGVLPASSTRVWVRGGELVLTLRNRLGFDLDGLDSMALAEVHATHRLGPDPFDPRAWLAQGSRTATAARLLRDSTLVVRAPVAPAAVAHAHAASAGFSYQWPGSAVEVLMDPEAKIESRLELDLELDSVDTRVFGYFPASFELPLGAGGSEARARSLGVAGTLTVQVENPYALPLTAYFRVNDFVPSPVSVLPGPNTFSFELDRGVLPGALSPPVALTGTVKFSPPEGQATVISPKRLITIAGRLEVTVVP